MRVFTIKTYIIRELSTLFSWSLFFYVVLFKCREKTKNYVKLKTKIKMSEELYWEMDLSGDFDEIPDFESISNIPLKLKADEISSRIANLVNNFDLDPEIWKNYEEFALMHSAAEESFKAQVLYEPIEYNLSRGRWSLDMWHFDLGALSNDEDFISHKPNFPHDIRFD